MPFLLPLSVAPSLVDPSAGPVVMLAGIGLLFSTVFVRRFRVARVALPVVAVAAWFVGTVVLGVGLVPIAVDAVERTAFVSERLEEDYGFDRVDPLSVWHLAEGRAMPVERGGLPVRVFVSGDEMVILGEGGVAVEVLPEISDMWGLG